MPLYIGKGKGKRAYQHLETGSLQNSKTFWNKKLNKLLRENTPPTCKIIENNLDEMSAFELEKSLILKYGRKDLKTGTLYNTADGGAGSAGHTVSEDGKRRIRLSMTGRHLGNQFRTGIPHSEEAKQKISKTMTGRTDSSETKAKKSEALAWQIEKQIETARGYVSATWWGRHITISYKGETRRQSEKATHRLYDVQLGSIVVKRTITDFRQGSCPKEFAHLRKDYP